MNKVQEFIDYLRSLTGYQCSPYLKKIGGLPTAPGCPADCKCARDGPRRAAPGRSSSRKPFTSTGMIAFTLWYIAIALNYYFGKLPWRRDQPPPDTNAPPPTPAPQ